MLFVYPSVLKQDHPSMHPRSVSVPFSDPKTNCLPWDENTTEVILSVCCSSNQNGGLCTKSKSSHLNLLTQCACHQIRMWWFHYKCIARWSCHEFPRLFIENPNYLIPWARCNARPRKTTTAVIVCVCPPNGPDTSHHDCTHHTLVVCTIKAAFLQAITQSCAYQYYPNATERYGVHSIECSSCCPMKTSTQSSCSCVSWSSRINLAAMDVQINRPVERLARSRIMASPGQPDTELHTLWRYRTIYISFCRNM
jgi:hypothetical protein